MDIVGFTMMIMRLCFEILLKFVHNLESGNRKTRVFSIENRGIGKTPKKGVFYPPGPEKGGRGGKKGSKTPKSANPEVPPGPEKSGFFQYDLVSFYRKMGFFEVFDKFEGSIFGGGGPKTGFWGGVSRFSRFSGEIDVFGKNGYLGCCEQRKHAMHGCNAVFPTAENRCFS